MDQKTKIKTGLLVIIIVALCSAFYLFSKDTLFDLGGNGLFTAGSVQASSGNQVTVKPITDTFVREAYNTKNYEKLNEIVSDGSPRVNSFLRFDLSKVDLSQASKIELAIKPTISRKIDKSIRLITSNWDASKVTWKTAPSFGATLGSIEGEVKENVVVKTTLNINEIKKVGNTLNIAIEDRSRGNSLTFKSLETNDPGATLIITMSSASTPSSSKSSSASSSKTSSSSTSTNTSITSSSISSTQSSSTTSANPGPVSKTGFWISTAEIKQQPTSGAQWEEVYKIARSNWGSPSIKTQDSFHDNYVMAGAIVCVRTGEFCDKAVNGVVSAIGTEGNTRWLNIGRNLLGYVIAADLLDLRADGNSNSNGSRVETWLASFLTKMHPDNNTGVMEKLTPFESGSNASAQEASVYAALAAYTQDRAKLDYVWNRFRLYSCDRTSPEKVIDLKKGTEYGWAHDNANPCGISPKGATKLYEDVERRLDGAITNDMWRGTHFRWMPVHTPYPWVGLEGYIPTALILSRQGYDAFEVSHQAPKRTMEYLWFLKENTKKEEWFDGKRADETIHIVNTYYGTNYPTQKAIGVGRTFGFTGYTHPDKANLVR